MKAVVYERFGPPEVLVWQDAADPVAGPGEIRVAMRAASVNLGEARTRAGVSGGAKAPGILGYDVAGIVESVGEGVSRFTVGDRVFGRANSSYAELVVTQADDCFLLPESLSFVQAAGAPLAFQTAWHGLVTAGGLTEGMNVYVVPGGGGVGMAGVQIARALGARVLAASSTAEKAAEVMARFAPDAVACYTSDDIASAAQQLGDGHGIDLALDGNGEPTFEQTLTTLGDYGKVMLYGAPAAGRIGTRVATLAYRGISIVGFAVTDSRYPITRAAFEREVIPRLADGRFSVPVAAVVPLPEAARAHAMLHSHRHVGKIVLENR